jgi:hypothetical protein
MSEKNKLQLVACVDMTVSMCARRDSLRNAESGAASAHKAIDRFFVLATQALF